MLKHFAFQTVLSCLVLANMLCVSVLPIQADDTQSAKSDAAETEKTRSVSLDALKKTGLQRSRFNAQHNIASARESLATFPKANLAEFQSVIRPLLEQHCIDCHGPDLQEGNIQVDQLNPNLLQGEDTDWWIEIFSVITKGEMPPPESSELTEAERKQIVNWLSDELHTASLFRKQSGSRSAFRRMTRYEFNYALQDLLGLPWDFAKDLPPEPHTEEGFENSAELLHLSTSQFETYHRHAREALTRAIVTGKRPQTVRWSISMQQAAEREWPKQKQQLNKARKELAEEPEKLNAEIAKLEESFRKSHRTAYYKQLSTGRTALATWRYNGAKYAFAPTQQTPVMPKDYDCVAVLPAGLRQNLVVELGNQLPDEGMMRVTARVSRGESHEPGFPSIRLLFGWQASNEGRALLPVSVEDIPVTGTTDNPQIVQWDIPLGEIYPRNAVRKTSSMGRTPSPSEYIRLANSSASRNDIHVDHVLVEAPYFSQWPPSSHRVIFFASDKSQDELAYAQELIQNFMTRAWRQPPTADEVQRKVQLFQVMRPQCDTFETAVVEVLATVLASPRFLYVGHLTDADSQKHLSNQKPTAQSKHSNDYKLASRLALFLWCSLPDEQLRNLAQKGVLSQPDVLSEQVERMLADQRSHRLAEQFVHQWLNLELLEFVNFKRHLGGFDPLLKQAMLEEPVELFAEMLRENASILDFVHADYAMLNERLAKHYGIKNVHGNDFRRIALDGNFQRGGILTQAGTLAMNSDWPDSHPLKRAIWLLERLLNDPPPPPPPAVPQIDLADPEIAKMTLKERIEDHRNHEACRSCHTKIDPWGIAFENYDALGRWRTSIKGKPVDASSELFNHQVLEGMEGLKRYFLEDRQDQFVQAMVHKLATFALGRPLHFEDRAEIESITANVRQSGDGLKTMILTIVQSELFQDP